LADGILFDLKTILDEEQFHGRLSSLASKVGKAAGIYTLQTENLPLNSNSKILFSGQERLLRLS